MQQRFEQFIRSEHLFPDGEQVLLAVSGGRDSVVLTDLVGQTRIPFAIAHCNFHLRPGECDRDEAFVRSLAQRYGVECHVAQFDTLAFAEEHRMSVEEAARQLRYDYFEKVRSGNGYSCIATAHHRDDAIETFFINLLRGTGLAGLQGIPLHNGHVVRPLLPFGRDEIDNYVRQHQLPYVDDSTNSQTLFLRNRIRLQLVPLLRTLSPAFDRTMQSNMSHLADADDIYRSAVEQQRSVVVQPDGDGFSIGIEALRQLTPVATWLFEFLRPYGFSSSVVKEIVESLDAQSGKQFFSPTHRLVKDRSRLLVTPLASKSDEVYVINNVGDCQSLPVGLVMQCSPNTGRSIRLKPDEAWFDSDCVAFPLTLRHWRAGDRFVPFGMRGSRLVSDLLSDLKLSLPDKEHIWLLCDASGTIMWVVGLRSSAVAPVSQVTKNILLIKLIG